MFEIVVLSGKGGTGKTSLTAAFAHLSKNTVICDLDVDTPDLHLVLHPDIRKKETFISGHEARIQEALCDDCGQCGEVCQFGAISNGGACPVINPRKCEGCKVCVVLCPSDAIVFPEKECGQWYVSQTRIGMMVHAQLFPGEENSGRLVALLRQRAKALAQGHNLEWILSDGPPGIGCPVISSLSGASLAVIVTEPTPSGLHDLERVVALCRHFRIAAGIVINKSDLHEETSRYMMSYCKENGFHFFGRLPYDAVVTKAIVEGKAVTEYQDHPFSKRIKEIWTRITSVVEEHGSTPPCVGNEPC